MVTFSSNLIYFKKGYKKSHKENIEKNWKKNKNYFKKNPKVKIFVKNDLKIQKSGEKKKLFFNPLKNPKNKQKNPKKFLKSKKPKKFKKSEKNQKKKNKIK